MCGIAGIFNFNGKPVDRLALMSMTDSLYHRGPDGEGHWVDQRQQVGLGHRRLSILDLDTAAGQPMHYGDRFTITYNGEIYNYLEIRQALEKAGHQFRTQSDTEVLIAAYAAYGADCLSIVDGMFAFAIWDEENQSLFCARDRFGEKPFFFQQQDKRLVFASEMKALFAIGVEREPDPQMLFKYLAYDVISDPAEPQRTFFKGIQKLPPATWMRFEADGSFRTHQYWSLSIPNHDNEGGWDYSKAGDSPDGSTIGMTRKFHRLLLKSVEQRMRSDVPVGSSLSGGLDSSSIVLLMHSLRKSTAKPQLTFSARFDDPKLDEGRYMQLISGRQGLEQHDCWPDAAILNDELEQLFYHQEEPFGSASILAQWSVMKLAAERNVTVLLDGQGADEILGGYPRYFRSFFSELYLEGSDNFDRERKAYKALYGKDYPIDWRFQMDAKAPGLMRKLGGLRRKMTTPTYLAALDQSFANSYKTEQSPFQVWSDLNETLKFSTTGYGLEKLLRFSDRNAMAHSREVRLPFLSKELVEFVFTLPRQFKIRDGWTKFLLRQSMSDLLPTEITWRRDKLGFEPPQRRWLETGPLAERIQEARAALKQARILKQPEQIPAWRCLMAAQLIQSQTKGVSSRRA